MRLIIESNKGFQKSAGIYDVCAWLVETYPKEIFVSEPKLVCDMRDYADNILKQKYKGFGGKEE